MLHLQCSNVHEWLFILWPEKLYINKIEIFLYNHLCNSLQTMVQKKNNTKIKNNKIKYRVSVSTTGILHKQHVAWFHSAFFQRFMLAVMVAWWCGGYYLGTLTRVYTSSVTSWGITCHVAKLKSSHTRFLNMTMSSADVNPAEHQITTTTHIRYMNSPQCKLCGILKTWKTCIG